jgi:hypothetical protein
VQFGLRLEDVMPEHGRGKSSRGSASREGHDEEAAMPYNPSEAGEPTRSTARQVLERNEATLLAIAGVVGVGIGRTPIGDDAIMLYLNDVNARSRAPRAVEGIPVLTTVTGPVDAYREQGP